MRQTKLWILLALLGSLGLSSGCTERDIALKSQTRETYATGVEAFFSAKDESLKNKASAEEVVSAIDFSDPNRKLSQFELKQLLETVRTRTNPDRPSSSPVVIQSKSNRSNAKRTKPPVFVSRNEGGNTTGGGNVTNGNVTNGNVTGSNVTGGGKLIGGRRVRGNTTLGGNVTLPNEVRGGNSSLPGNVTVGNRGTVRRSRLIVGNTTVGSESGNMTTEGKQIYRRGVRDRGALLNSDANTTLPK